MEKIIPRVRPKEPEAALRELEEFVQSIKGLPIAEAEQKIAEARFRKPIVIFNAFAIRPFWRDGRKAPPLFPRKTIKITSDKAISIMARGH
mgnify:CR=1 FL=1